MGLTGLEGFGQLARNLEKLARVPSQVAGEVSEEIAGFLQEQFDNGTDSYGNPWAPLKPQTIKSGRNPPPGTDTRAMRESIEVVPMAGAGIQVTIGADYAEYFSRKRPILPVNTMPKKWNDAIKAAAEGLAERAVRGE